MKDYESTDFRWASTKTREKLSYKESLRAACRYYGTFAGRWHSNEFWAALLQRLDDMTEEECHSEMINIEKRADADLRLWELYQ